MDDKLNKFYGTYGYSMLIKDHPDLNEHGIWEVKGEDPNCDFGGHHHQPLLGHYEGKLIDVINIAVELPKFWTWGAGGSIAKIDLKKAYTNTNARKQKLTNQIKELEQQLHSLKSELNSL